MAPTPQLLIVSPLFPPARGGLPDHTAHLAEALRSAGADVAVLTTRGPVADTSVPVYPDVADWQQPAEILAAKLQHTDDWIAELLQAEESHRVQQKWWDFRQNLGHAFDRPEGGGFSTGAGWR